MNRNNSRTIKYRVDPHIFSLAKHFIFCIAKRFIQSKRSIPTMTKVIHETKNASSVCRIKHLHDINVGFGALHFANNCSGFGIFHPSPNVHLFASIFCEFGKVTACETISRYHFIRVQ